jgi:transposase
MEKLLQQIPLQRPQRHRTHVLRLKDCRRLATRYDKLAANFLGNIYLAAAIMWWL